MSGTHGSSLGITIANKYGEHTFYWKPLHLQSEQMAATARRGDGNQKQVISATRALEKFKNRGTTSEDGIPALWGVWPRGNEPPGPRLLPWPAEDGGFLSRGVASEKVCLQRHLEHLKVQVRSPAEKRDIKWQATCWKGNLERSSPGSASKTLVAGVSSMETLNHLKRRT